jgi:hypothetical protein
MGVRIVIPKMIVWLENREGWAQKKFRPERKYGPRKWPWFLTVIRNEFLPSERDRLPEAPAADVPASCDELARATEAIEVSDAADSLVRIYTCKCGAEIREYALRIVGECTRAQNPRAPLGKETSAGRLARATIGTTAHPVRFLLYQRYMSKGRIVDSGCAN